jgi:hypothetical protein
MIMKDNKEQQKPEVQESTQNIEGQPQRVKDYDAYWGVTGYYLDSEGFDIRDRD